MLLFRITTLTLIVAICGLSTYLLAASLLSGPQAVPVLSERVAKSDSSNS
jgi:hypothetical protein